MSKKSLFQNPLVIAAIGLGACALVMGGYNDAKAMTPPAPTKYPASDYAKFTAGKRLMGEKTDVSFADAGFTLALVPPSMSPAGQFGVITLNEKREGGTIHWFSIENGSAMGTATVAAYR